MACFILKHLTTLVTNVLHVITGSSGQYFIACKSVNVTITNVLHVITGSSGQYFIACKSVNVTITRGKSYERFVTVSYIMPSSKITTVELL